MTRQSRKCRAGVWVALATMVGTVVASELPRIELGQAQGRPLRQAQGRPAVFVDGKAVPLVGYSPMTWSKGHTEKSVPRFLPHKMGYYLLAIPSVGNDFFGTPFWVGDAVGDGVPVEAPKASPHHYAAVDEPVALVLNGDPDATLMIRFGIYEPQTWRKLHADEYFITEEGTPGSAPSMASDEYWNKAAQFSAAVVRYCESRPWAARVIGYANFHRTEGTYEPAINGWVFDHSPLMQRRWRTFLKEKYGTVEKLRGAWHDPAIESLETVTVPRDRLRGRVNDVAAQLYWQAGRDNQPLRDYLELQRDLFHQRFRQVADAMKKAADRDVLMIHDALKQPMLGWDIDEFFEMEKSRSPADPELMSASGHIGVADLFDAPGCDGLITPHDYQARGAGGVFEPEGAADSAVLRGKVFLCEMDTRTYTDAHNGYGKARDLKEFSAVTWRNVATALSRGWVPYWMDLSADWFSAPEMHPIIERQVQVMKQSLGWPHETVPGIAVVLDDAAPLETSGAGNYLAEAVMGQIRGGLSRCGVPYRVYLMEDLARPDFPDHRVFYFPCLFRADEARLALLKEKVFRDGRVVVWGPGSGISDGATIGTASVERLTGFRCEMIRANYPRRVQISRFEHPVTRGLPADCIYGSAVPYGPLLFPTNGVELGQAWTKQGRHAVGLAVLTNGKGARGEGDKGARGAGDWASVFTAAVPLPADLWRNLARYGGAHIYNDGNDLVVADRRLVALHSLQSGKKVLHLPSPCRVTDLVTGEVVARKTAELRFVLDAPETKVFLCEP